MFAAMVVGQQKRDFPVSLMEANFRITLGNHEIAKERKHEKGPRSDRAVGVGG
jgi:hypothetical protein